LWQPKAFNQEVDTTLWDKAVAELLDIIEWNDDSADTLVWRFPRLGQTYRKTGNVLHITPAKEGVLALKRKVGTVIRRHVSAPMPILVKKLNETLRSALGSALGSDLHT